jgi:putative oxidoreductase
MVRWLSRFEPWGATLLRLVLGVAMVYHGYAKVVPAHGLDGEPLSAIEHYSHYVASLGMPAWLGYVSALTEFVGGGLLVLGLLTRFAALMVAGNMLVAMCSVSFHRGYAAAEYPVALFAIAAMLVFVGGGAAAADGRFGSR